MEPMPRPQPASKSLHVARWLIGFMVLGVVLSSLDIVFQYLPAYPALQPVRNGPWPWQLASAACAPLGVAILLCVQRKPVLAFCLSIVLPVVFVLTRIYLWKQLGAISYVMPIVPFLIAQEAFVARRSDADRVDADGN